MFCVNCGTQLPEGARFCINCGIAMAGNQATFIKPQGSIGTRIVPAICTSCRATLEVNGDEKLAICPFCDSSYIVDQAIHNYDVNMRGNLTVENATINVIGSKVENLLIRARTFEEEGELEAALDYYNRVLDIDFSNEEGQEGLERVKDIIKNYVYFETEANSIFKFGRLQLKKGILIFKDNKGKETIYDLNNMRNIRKTVGCLGFLYSGKITEITYGCNRASEWVEVLGKAQLGIYTEMKTMKRGELEEYVLNNFSSKSKVKAIKFYRERTGIGLAEAKAIIDELFD